MILPDDRRWPQPWMFLFVCLLAAFTPARGGECRYLPFDHDSAALLVRRAVETKLIPRTLQSDGLTLAVTELTDFAMDWDRGEFTLACAFRLESPFLPRFGKTGEVSLTGSVLIAETERRLGLKLLRVNGFRIGDAAGLGETVAGLLLNRNLAGKEFWGGDPPAGAVLPAAGLDSLLRAAVDQALPRTWNGASSSFTLESMEDLLLMDEPGRMRARVRISGSRRGLFHLAFTGSASLEATVLADPENLAGLVRMERLDELALDGYPRFICRIARSWAERRIRGQEWKFAWD